MSDSLHIPSLGSALSVPPKVDVDTSKPGEKLAELVFSNTAWRDLVDRIENQSSRWQNFVNSISFPQSALPSANVTGALSGLSDDDMAKADTLDRELLSLRTEVQKLARQLDEQKLKVDAKDNRIEDLVSKSKELATKEQLNFVFSRVNVSAQRKLLQSPKFLASFSNGSMCNAFVLAVDIRRSTELMLKARSAQQFSVFITTLCQDLEDIVKDCYGVFDKFTGDGILAFFPDFFSGADAGHFAIRAAQRCHDAFARRYLEFRTSFNPVPVDVGLGIGLDFGQVHLVRTAGGLSVVGAPVVYACRMSGAPSGVTLLNQQAYEEISNKHGSHCLFHETHVDLKHEGKTLAYEVAMNGREAKLAQPQWPD